MKITVFDCRFLSGNRKILLFSWVNDSAPLGCPNKHYMEIPAHSLQLIFPLNRRPLQGTAYLLSSFVPGWCFIRDSMCCFICATAWKDRCIRPVFSRMYLGWFNGWLRLLMFAPLWKQCFKEWLKKFKKLPGSIKKIWYLFTSYEYLLWNRFLYLLTNTNCLPVEHLYPTAIQLAAKLWAVLHFPKATSGAL